MINVAGFTAGELRLAARMARDCAARAHAADQPRVAALYGTLAQRLTEVARNRPDTPTPPEIYV